MEDPLLGQVENAQRILDAVVACCEFHNVAFKFLPSLRHLIRSNMKYAPRGSSGKFVTIYPTTDGQTEALLRELDMTIGGEVGPYILSDLRYNEGPLYIRYGAFRSDFVRDDLDDLVPAICRPDGTLEPDLRKVEMRSLASGRKQASWNSSAITPTS
ncbi:MAG TPA: hypothetical protein VNJ54_04330 [Plantibacter sp.]|uniref:class III lanthionine synthetase LanKC N-terminal domain-containing protein n=1 Tax=unclassified Plantibacter TaxID=2624265 RepID=UPI002D165386|nr:hypothetical protein [Plantibacter sp.]